MLFLFCLSQYKDVFLSGSWKDFTGGMESHRFCIGLNFLTIYVCSKVQGIWSCQLMKCRKIWCHSFCSSGYQLLRLLKLFGLYLKLKLIYPTRGNLFLNQHMILLNSLICWCWVILILTAMIGNWMSAL